MDRTSTEANAGIFHFRENLNLGRKETIRKKMLLEKENVKITYRLSDVEMNPVNCNSILIKGAGLHAWKGQLICVANLETDTVLPIFKVIEFFETEVSSYKRITAVFEGVVKV